MRLFQNSGLYAAYVRRLAALRDPLWSFERQRTAFLDDRFGAPHFLLPVLDGSAAAFFTNGDDEVLQRRWAQEHGLRTSITLEEILLAQIEEHKTEVFYNIDPMRYQSAFLQRLPGCVRKSIAWRAAPSPNADFSAYDLVVCNFPSILDSYRRAGWRGAYFSPAHDPVMDEYATSEERPIDILFVGGYSRHHRRRGQLLEAFANLQARYNIVFHLDSSRLTRAAETALGRLLPLAKYRRPLSLQKISREAIFGLDLYAAISKAKIVLNGAIDMAGEDRGNMRCFEAMGCGALLLTDDGHYPEGMLGGTTMLTYRNSDDAIKSIDIALNELKTSRDLARNGHEMVRSRYSKVEQWRHFQELAAAA